MSCSKTLLAAMAALLLALPVAAPAQDDVPTDDELSVEVEVVISATRTDELATAVAATVNTIPQQEIRRSQASHAGDVLKTTPGLGLVQSGSPGGVTSVFTRGGNNNQTLVLIDGVRINDPMAGGADLSSITLDQVGRIETVKGPFGTLYGADAMVGVISLFTAPGSQTEDTARVGAGSMGTRRVGFSVGSGEGDRGLALSGSWYSTDGVRAVNNDYDGFSVVGRWDTPVLGGGLALTSRYWDYDAGVPGPTNFPSDSDNQTAKGSVTALNWKREGVSARDTVHLGMFQQDYTYRYMDFMANPQVSRARPRYFEASVQRDWLLPDTTLTAGAEWKELKGRYDDTSAGSYRADNTSKALFGQVQHELGQWRLIGGVRHQDEDLFPSRTTWRTGVTRLGCDEMTAVWANYGTGYRAPTFNELFFPFMGNPELRPETSKSWEVGLWDVIGRGQEMRVAFFRNDFDNLIEWRETAPFTWQPVNVASARTQGVELEISRKLSTCWSDRVAFTRLATWSDGAQLLRRPTYAASYALSYGDERLEGLLNVTYVGRRLDARSFMGPEIVGSYFVVDLGASYALSSDWDLWLRVNNLLDKDYEAAANYPSPGANFVLGVSRTM